jgi:hypothetical protein
MVEAVQYDWALAALTASMKRANTLAKRPRELMIVVSTKAGRKLALS